MTKKQNKTHVAFLWPACFPLKFKQEKLKYTTVCTPSHSSDSFSFPHCLPNGLGFFPAVHPFPNPINSSCFRRQNNTLQTSPFIHSWHWTKLSPPSAGYLTHVSARLLYVNSGAHTHAQSRKELIRTTHISALQMALVKTNVNHKVQTDVMYLKY